MARIEKEELTNHFGQLYREEELNEEEKGGDIRLGLESEEELPTYGRT